MKATDAIRVERQIPQPPGQPARTVTEVVCPHCLKPVGAVQHTVNGEPFRAHNERLDDGTLCPHGQTERDLAGTIPAF
jgi:hypothetical protein